jgi:hypothetical protein
VVRKCWGLGSSVRARHDEDGSDTHRIRDAEVVEEYTVGSNGRFGHIV